MIEDRVRRSIQIMKDNLPVKDFSKDFPLIVNFSGGKDSTVCLLLAGEITDHVVCFYMNAGLELPETVPYVKARAKELGYPLIISDPVNYPVKHRNPGPLVGAKNLWDYIERNGYFPTASQRWCSIYCKQRPGKVCLRAHFGGKPLRKLVGVKTTDSARRKSVYGDPKNAEKFGGFYQRPDAEMAPYILVYPILWWTSQECRDYILRSGYDLHEGYKRFGMSGCAWCPVYKPDVLRRVHEAYPNIYDELLRVEEKLGIRAYIHADRTLAEVLEDERITDLKPKKKTKE